jgi:hypothetical protein
MWSLFANWFHINIVNIGILIIYTLLGTDSICTYVPVILCPELCMQKFLERKKICMIYSYDSDASDTPEKSMKAGKYRNCIFEESSDSETSSFNEESPSASDSSSPITMADKNAAVGTELSKAESSNADEGPVLETSTSGKFTVEHKGFKSPIQNVVGVSDAVVKTVKDDKNDSSVQTKEVSSIYVLK